MKKMDKTRKLNLQFFAEEPPKEEPPKEEPPKEEPPKEEPQKEEPQKEEPKPPERNSSERYASAAEVGELLNLVKLQGEQVKQTHQLMTNFLETFKETDGKLREMIALLENVIGQQDAETQNLIKATASLVKIHQQQQKRAD